MPAKQGVYEVKSVLRKELSEALNETPPSIEIELSEVNINETYSVKGSFKVVPFLSATSKKTGKIEAELDDKLKIVSLKISEDQQQ
jgi:hypothetical protein